MGDIVGRLEANAEDYTGELQCEAAAEIRRLRMALTDMVTALEEENPLAWPRTLSAARAALKGEK